MRWKASNLFSLLVFVFIHVEHMHQRPELFAFSEVHVTVSDTNGAERASRSHAFSGSGSAESLLSVMDATVEIRRLRVAWTYQAALLPGDARRDLGFEDEGKYCNRCYTS